MIEKTFLVPGATAKDIYNVWLNSKEHSRLIGDTAEIQPKVGGSFSAFSGYATGKFIALVEDFSIEQTWRASDWPYGHESNVKLELMDVSDGVQIHFTQINLPEGTEEEFTQGWQGNYWDRLELYFS